jgi:hypothetical protein
MTKYKVLCTGNPNNRGISSAAKKWFSDIDFISKSKGFDFTSGQGIIKLKNILKNYNVIINSSYICAGVQIKILETANEVDFKGHIFSIGSMAEFDHLSHFRPDYSIEKQELRRRSTELMSKSFRATHVIVSGFQDNGNSSNHKMDAIQIMKTIQWVLDCEMLVPIISIIDPVCIPEAP